MTISTYNQASPNKFALSIAGLDDTNYFVQKTNLPALQIGTNTVGTTDFTDLILPGDKIAYSDLKIDFLVDGNLDNWDALHQWIRRNAKANNPERSQATLSILTNNYVQNFKVVFYDLFPYSLNEIPFDSSLNEDNLIISAAGFKYTYYDVIRSSQ